MSSSSNIDLTSRAVPPVKLSERLGSTLFMAALAHGVVILGVTFSGYSLPDSGALPSLNVTLVVDRDKLMRDELSELMAETSQLGAGRVAEGDRPTTTLSTDSAQSREGNPFAVDSADARPRTPAPAAEQLVTSAPTDTAITADPKADEASSAEMQTAAALIERTSEQTLALEIDEHARMPSQDNVDDIAAPTTQESILATYLDGWRRRVERIGTVNFPSRFRGEHGFGKPTLEVAIAADGSLSGIVVRRSSGNAALDQAALDILRLASPFEPLPEAIKARYDILRFAYEWEFSGGTGTPADEVPPAAL